jgi:hypothetical protein
MLAYLKALHCVEIVENFNTSYRNVSNKMYHELSLTYQVPRQNGPLVADIEVKTKQDRQCTYNVTLRSVRVTIVAVGKQ